ncbi:hypothetical protein PtrSN002B_011198 [Pyrenophora tritici-repentis]|uniref:Uncharacterized protein n=1 Tax=Pyrenophora tritici-repentis TaxID=45151 RepID=A0A2W1HH05_9PLEO|nr:hypothetical protein PtrV1_01469 [Pyrenophora tritici-repentis]KAF7454206.1 hypothetical protein A1F99_014640 [Pyrenophora tritici-repentis]KAF7577298.1 hypothetical protein PtrM4_015380 [Pyrenophora tritici-repentis]KAG9387954.1 hypothetical protein A1F94_000846 [Pyrenophora tritici-repentis]KAI0575147.1 hypothetical protein Alg215_08186 [Pyrenophora tritici-repentis]
MATLSPDVRDSTLKSLKLTCPSAEGIQEPPSPSTSDDSPIMEQQGFPFPDMGDEWSDEEVLIPRQRKKPQFIPPLNFEKITALSGETSSAGSTSTSPSPNRMGAKASPLVPPKSPSRPDASRGSSQDDLIQRFYQVTKERDALRKELQRRSVGVSGMPARGSMVARSEENALIEELQALRYEIRVWSEEYFSGPIKASSKRPYLHRAKELFGNLTDNYQTYLKHPEERPLLIQAYVWMKLQQKIFNNWNKGSGYVWAGKLGDKKLRDINDTLRKAVRNEAQAEEYHLWRSMTVNLLVPQVDGKWRPTFDAAPVLKRISRFCSRMRRKLRPWSTQSLRSGKERLSTIVSASVALDLKMKRQLADYRFVTFTGGKKDQYWGYGYYDSEMEDVYDDDDDDMNDGYGASNIRGRRVELALAPALERCGNANGHVFDQSFMMVKADVSCKRLEKTKKQQQQPRARSRASTSRQGTAGGRKSSTTFSALWGK